MPYDEEAIGLLLGTLPPPPPGWVAAASELPRVRRALTDLGRLLTDAEARSAETARLESALAQAGYEPTPELVRAVQRELGRGTSE
jgi:hypothetical protein